MKAFWKSRPVKTVGILAALLVLGMLIATYIFVMGVRLIVDGVNILLGEPRRDRPKRRTGYRLCPRPLGCGEDQRRAGHPLR